MTYRAGARIEAGQEVAISKDGTVVPWRDPQEPPKVGQRVRISLDGLVVQSDPQNPGLMFVRLDLGGCVWRIPLDAMEVIS